MGTVLIVDDNDASLCLLETVLKAHGFQVIAARDGKVALDEARTNPPDLIISDMLMPVMDGFELCRECKSDDTLKHIPFIFYTSTYTESKDERFALSLGADRCITKPQEPDALMAIIEEVMAEKGSPQETTEQPLGEEMEFFKQHNEILFKKLEKKMLDLKTANRELEDWQERYRLSMEHVADIICTVGSNLVITDMSPSVERLMGVKPDYFIGRSVRLWKQFLKPESFERIMDNIHQVLQEGVAIPSATYEFVAQDKSTLYIEISGAPITKNNEIVGLVSVARDVTARMVAEEGVRHHQRLLEAVNRVLTKALTAPTVASVAEMCLAVGQELTGSRFGFIGKITPDGRLTTTALSDPGWTECRIAEDQAVLQITNMVIRGIWGEVIRQESALIINDPESFPERVGVPEGHPPITAFLGAPLKEQNRVIGMIAMANNESGYTTEQQEDLQTLATFCVEAIRRKEVEESLKDSESKYRSIFEESNDAILLTVPDGSILDANPAACRMFGMSVDEIRKAGRNGLVDLSDPQLKTALEERKRTGKIVNAEFTMIRANGDKFPVEGTSTIYTDAQGKPRTAMIVRDISERKEAELQREAVIRELRHEKEFNETLIQNSPAFFVATDKYGKTIMMNESLLLAIGYTEDEVEGTDYLSTFVTEPERKSVSKVFSQLTTTDYPARNTNTVLAKNGKRLLVEWRNMPVFTEMGEFDYFFSVGIDITERTKMEEDLRQSFEQVRKGLRATVQAMAETVETRDPYTAGHQRRVSDLARSIATEMKLPKDRIEGLRMAATIHDLGKISIPAEILSKPAALTETEFALIKEHPRAGFDILKNIDFPWPVARMVLEHHERINSSGYPNSLKGDETLLESRILAVADVVEAMASHRPYRAAWGVDVALEEISRNRGILYDPEAVDACLRLFNGKGYQLSE